MTTYTYREAVAFANAAGRDAANRSAQRNGRKVWNEIDLEAAQEASDAVLARLGFGHLVEE
jgi:hypothetical protein